MRRSNYEIRNNGSVLLISGTLTDDVLSQVSELTKLILGIEHPTIKIRSNSIVSGSSEQVEAYLNSKQKKQKK